MKNGIILPPATAGKSFTITNLSDEPLEVYPHDRKSFILAAGKATKIRPKKPTKRRGKK